MSLQSSLMGELKTAMKAKDQLALAALRAIKSELLLVQTSGDAKELSEDDEVKILQKLVKQRKDSATIFTEQGRLDLAKPELAQAEVISKFLPAQLSEQEVDVHVLAAIEKLEASSMKDMGKVMGFVSDALSGQADGKTISNLVKKHLS